MADDLEKAVGAELVDGQIAQLVDAQDLGLDVGGKSQDVDIYSVHIPSPGPYEPRVDQLIDVLSSIPTDRLRIVAADFNITVSIRQDAEELKNTPGERRIQLRLRKELGLANAWQEVNPNTHLPKTARAPSVSTAIALFPRTYVTAEAKRRAAPRPLYGATQSSTKRAA